jgi:hypothetical protein
MLGKKIIWSKSKVGLPWCLESIPWIVPPRHWFESPGLCTWLCVQSIREVGILKRRRRRFQVRGIWQFLKTFRGIVYILFNKLHAHVQFIQSLFNSLLTAFDAHCRDVNAMQSAYKWKMFFHRSAMRCEISFRSCIALAFRTPSHFCTFFAFFRVFITLFPHYFSARVSHFFRTAARFWCIYNKKMQYKGERSI